MTVGKASNLNRGSREHASRAAFAAVVTESLRAGRRVRLRVQGSSMRPWLPEGTPVHVAPVSLHQLRRGDVALFSVGAERLILHRVVRAVPPTARCCRCRGDAAVGSGETVAAEAVLGRVVAVERAAGRISAFGRPDRWVGACWQALPWVRRGVLGRGRGGAEGQGRGHPGGGDASVFALLPQPLQGVIGLCRAGLGVPGRAIDPEQVRALLPTILSHRVIPLAYLGAHRLGGEEDVPALRRAHLQWCARDLQLRVQLRSVLATLAAKGVEAAVFKGPALADRLGRGRPWRQYDDLDLIVRREDQAAAVHALLDEGYLWSAELPRDRIPAAALADLEFSLWAPARRYLLEISTTGIQPYFAAIPAEALWERMLPFELDEVGTVPVLEPSMQLLLLCVHGAKHAWHRLAWVCDVARWLHCHDAGAALDQARLLARRWHLETMLELGLTLARGLVAGGEARCAAPSPRVSRCVEQVLWRWAQDAHPDGLKALYAFHQGVQDGARQRLHYHRALALSPSHADLRVANLPPSLHPLYTALRPVRVVVQRGRRAFATKEPGALDA